jgi:hypothetical protein
MKLNGIAKAMAISVIAMFMLLCMSGFFYSGTAMASIPNEYGIYGYVKDSSSQPINQATVTCNGLSTTTNVNGYYYVYLEARGTYSVSVRKSGYLAQTKAAETTTVPVRLDFNMGVKESDIAWFDSTQAGTNGYVGGKRSMQIDYYHTSSATMKVELLNPSGAIVKSWTVAHTHSCTSLLYDIGIGPQIGSWGVRVNSPYAGTEINTVNVGYILVKSSQLPAWPSQPVWGDISPLNVSTRVTQQTQYLTSGIGYVTACTGVVATTLFYNDGHQNDPVIQIRVGSYYEDLNWDHTYPLPNIHTFNTARSVTIHLDKVVWNSGNGMTYGTSGSGGSIDYSQINFATQDFASAAKNLTYPQPRTNNQWAELAYKGTALAIGVVCPEAGLALSVFGLALVMLRQDDPSAINNAYTGTSDVDASAYYTYIPSEGSKLRAETGNSVNLFLGGMSKSCCFKIYSTYRYMVGPIVYDLTTPATYVCYSPT